MNYLVKIVNAYESTKKYLFETKKIYTIEENKNTESTSVIAQNNKKSLYSKYLIVKFLTYFSNVGMLNMASDLLLYLIDTDYPILKIEKMNRNYIFENINLEYVANLQSDNDPNELMMQRKDKMVRDIFLNDKSIKQLIENYSDKSKKHCHSIKNIFLIKNIDYSKSDKIIVKYFGKKIKEHNLIDVINKHIMVLYE